MRRQEKKSPRVVGTGLVVLDITVIGGAGATAHRVWTGGTCANVLAILAFLGWRSDAIGRIGTDAAGACLLRDLLDSGVNPLLLDREPTAGTPVILHRVSRNKEGKVRHGYGFACPQCDRRYPSYRPLLVTRAAEVAESVKGANVFFFDRASRGVLDLAAQAKAAGALVMFEPSASTDEKHFREAVQLSDILKYAHDRREKFQTALDFAKGDAKAALEIETHGADGLAYRCAGDKRWIARAARSVSQVRDASGAGDWLSAGLLHVLAASSGARRFPTASIEEGLAVGEALAAFNCQFEGPRGAMYASKDEFSSHEIADLDIRLRRKLASSTKRPSLEMTLTGVCVTCAARAASESRSTPSMAAASRGVRLVGKRT